MGLRCLLGHDFGEPEIQRERQEEGNEVVVTVRDVKTCTRCGEEQVVSENKEVTSIHAQFAAADDDGVHTPDEPAADIADDDAAIIDESATDATDFGEDDVTGTPPDGADGADDVITDAEDDEPAFDPPQTAEEDDGIILDDDDDEEPERQPGEWPDAEDVGRDDDRMPTLEEVEGEVETADDPTPWPDQQGEDEGFSAEVSDGSAADVDFGNKLAPELDGDDGGVKEGYDAEFIGNAADEAQEFDAPASGGFTRAETLSREEAADVATEYYCPACEMTRPASKSSMRAGDICPECRHGYVTERER